MNTYEIECGGEIHEIGLDDEGYLYLLSHDPEEEAALKQMGLPVTRCTEALEKLATSPSMALLDAAVNGETDLAKLSLDVGADINVMDGSPLHAAVDHGHVAVASYFLEQGADVDSLYGTALRLAVRNSDRDMVRVLLSNGAKVDFWNYESLVIAGEKGDDEIINLLIKAGADPSVLEHNDEDV